MVDVDGHRLTLTNLGKVLYPETGTTKGDVLEYYRRASSAIIRHSSWRPVTRKRWVHGIGTAEEPGQMFFQKNLDDSTPSWVTRGVIQHRDHINDYPLVNDLATLIWLGQIATLELHTPQWQFGRTGVQRNPDRMVLDLDPGPGTGLAECAEVARRARVILLGMGLDPLPVTSGSKGIHLYSALDGTQNGDAVNAVAHELARALEADHPDLVVSEMKKSLRDGKVLVDWSQNNPNKTTIAPYSLRGRSRPTVAAPRRWEELDETGFAQLEYPAVLDRLDEGGDLLVTLTSGYLLSLEPTAARMTSFEATGVSRDRLAKYRSMRDSSKTPEPVPDVASAEPAGNSFVIQEHHARRLHFDFRLEHEGVLVSWALPKGVPTDPAQNHLAVQTEDHPLEYGTFEGTIPGGEYGAGEVTIWDSGTVELEKWREGKEVIVTLTGERHGIHKYAIIHTGGRSGGSLGAAHPRGESNWLMHLMAADGTDTPPTSARGARAPKTTMPGSRMPQRPRTTVGAPRRSTKAVSPMLATLRTAVELEATDDDWVFEMKWDGIRAIVYLDGGNFSLISRNGNNLTASYPDLAQLATTVMGDAVLDGEIVAYDRRGHPDFGLLQSRMNLTKPGDVEAAACEVPVYFIAFDLLEHDGIPTTTLPWHERRELLEHLITPGGRLQMPPVFEGHADAAIAASLSLGLEGIVAKRRDSTYTPGRRSNSWVKVKHHLAQEVVIGGWRPGKGRRAGQVGSLLMGVPGVGGALHYVGRVGTGFRDSDLDTITHTLVALARTTAPFDDVPNADASDANWVTPTLVGEVEFAEWTSTGRLRQPSWRGWRPDKAAADVVRETQ